MMILMAGLVILGGVATIAAVVVLSYTLTHNGD